ncbi:TetR/AcrR family transcriptional regulator [Microbacteriaceae bacterium VKM Ac-2854]|nr:TetR/AcrR family transcriptional regulator [Microbacteriaceae bacterium VKM Ac-2854]
MIAAAPYHHGNLRAELLAAAERTLGDVGAEGLSLRALARELGVSHAAPAKHFADKRALLDALAIEGFSRMVVDFQAATARSGPSSRDRLQALATSYLAFAAANPSLLALMFEHKTEPDASPEVVAAGHGSMALAVALVTEGQAAGEIVAGDPKRIATVAFAAVHGIATLGAGGLLEGTPTAEILPDAMATLWTGLAAER